MVAHARMGASDQSYEPREDVAMFMLQTSASTSSRKSAKDVDMSPVSVTPASRSDALAAGEKAFPSFKSWPPSHATADRVTSQTPQALKDVSSAKKVIFLNSKYPLDYPEAVDPEAAEPEAICPVSCTITKKTSMLTSADAVIFNPLWMQPVTRTPVIKPSNQKWVFTFYFESPSQVNRNQSWYTTKRLNGRIDWTMSFDNASDIFWPMSHLQPKQHFENAGSKNFLEGKQHLLLFVASNCGGQRFELIHELKARLPQGSVHVYGGCGKPVPCPGIDEKTACFKAWFSKYKFFASFENSCCDGYVTEKFTRAFYQGMVPVVFGGSSRDDYERIAPADSFLYVEDFRSVDDLAERLLSAASNETEYNKFFAWRSQFDVQDGTPKALCDLCQMLHNGTQAMQIHSDLMSTYMAGDEKMCRKSNFLVQRPALGNETL